MALNRMYMVLCFSRQELSQQYREIWTTLITVDQGREFHHLHKFFTVPHNHVCLAKKKKETIKLLS